MTVAVARFPTFADAPARGYDPERDAALVEAARAGDPAAFGALVDLHQRAAVRTALAALGRLEDAEDAAQEAFIVAWRKLDGFRGEATFRTWLLTIVWRKALDRRRRRAAWWQRLVHSRADGPDDPFATLPSSGHDPEGGALAREEVERVRTRIARLTPKLRDTLLLAASGELTYEQIAAVLGAPVGTIKWRVAEARRLVSAGLEN